MGKKRQQPITITVCGRCETVQEGETIYNYLMLKGIDPVRVVVEVNREIVPRNQYATWELHEGDQVEIVHFVGGGER